MEYTYNVLNNVYYWMLSGKKNVEVRLLKEKSESIHTGDFITFNNQEKENKYIKVKVTNKLIFNSIYDLLSNYDINRIAPDHTQKELIKLVEQIYGDKLTNGNFVAFEFEYITSDLDIEIDKHKEPYIKRLTSDNIINLTGQSGSGKSYYAKESFGSDEYEIIDTDDIFSEKRFNETTGVNKELGNYFRTKYEILPNLTDDFDLIYNEIINYYKDLNKTLIIDCAQFHCCKDIKILKR